MTFIGLGIVVLALAVGLLMLLRPARRPERDDRDDAVLEEAEREVRDLGAMTTPDEADDQLEDWGPGAPK